MDYQNEELVKKAISKLRKITVYYPIAPTPTKLVNDAIDLLNRVMLPADRIEQQYQEDYKDGHGQR